VCSPFFSDRAATMKSWSVRSSAPLRMRPFRSYSCDEWRHVLKYPSDVILSLFQEEQNFFDMAGMTPMRMGNLPR